MATTAAPYGLRPVNLIGGLPYSGSTRLIKIASAYATNIFYGDIVSILAAGTIAKVTATGADGTTNAFPAGVVGVFMGCTYTDPNLNYKVFKQYWPASTVASDAFAYVVDDPNVVFQAQADATMAQSTLGSNVCVVQTAGSTTTGDSKVALSASSSNTSTFLPFRVVGFVDGPFSAVGDTYTDCLVKFNTGIHSYTSATGI
jgi:hypothetical protein